jgi:hypothetical protein
MAFGSVMKPVSLLLTAVLSLMPASGSIAACYDRTDGSQRRFVLNGGEAFDIKTGLTWKRCSVGTMWDGARHCRGETSFVTLDEAKRLASAAGSGWRVPSGPELESIIDRGCGSPVVDKAVFPDIRPDEDGAADYWTTNAVGAANLIYFFDFMTGRADGHSRGFHLAVRLVRDGR